MTEGTLVAWKKKKGDQVSAGEVLAEIETDKATMEWESPEDGTLTKIYVEEGGKVNVGDKIAFIGGEGEEAPKEEDKEKEKEEKAEKPPTDEKEKEEKPEAKEKETEEEKPKAEEKEEKKAEPAKAEKKTEAEKPAPRIEKGEEARVKASPVARRIAAELGVDLSSVKGTGPEGRVTETDVRSAVLPRDRHRCRAANGGAGGIEVGGRRRGCRKNHSKRFCFKGGRASRSQGTESERFVR